MHTRIAIALLLATSAPAALAGDANLRVVGTGIEGSAGSFIVRVYQDADAWLGDGWRTQKVVAVAGHAKDGTISVELTLPPGEYALSVFHDVDDDGRLARNFIGIPKEPAGLSNNVRPKFGPPRFKDAKFSVGTTPVEQRIALD
ncbi:MAG: DUF2141 domain-containing protein [Gammaproteobacteria bacterium]|nr:DUF2141 domain-containing protein [Gammaproteobacteria bacterium]